MRPTTATGDNVFDFEAILHPGIVFEHLRENLFELQSNPLSHDTDAINGVDEGLSFRLQDVSNKYFHGLFRKTYPF